MRRLHPGEGAKKPEAQYHPEGAAVDATGVRHEGHASYPGRSVALPCATGVARRRDGAAEVSRGRSSRPIGEGLNLSEKLDRFSDRLEQMPRKRAQAGGSGRKPRDNAGRL